MPSRKDGDIPKASSAATHPAFRWPRSKARCSISSANWVFDLLALPLLRNPPAAHRSLS